MNVRQQKYKENLIIGMSKRNAALAAGYSRSTAVSHTKDIDNRIDMPDVLEQQGLTDKVLTAKLIDLLNASKVVGYLHNYKKGAKGGNERISPDEAISNEFLEVPDWGARAKGLELAFRLKDKLKDKIDQSLISYTRMTIIQIKDKEMELDLGEIPQAIKEKIHDRVTEDPANA